MTKEHQGIYCLSAAVTLYAALLPAAAATLGRALAAVYIPALYKPPARPRQVGPLMLSGNGLMLILVIR